MKLEYKKDTDKVQKVTLDSKIIHSEWRGKNASIGGKASLIVYTHFVGNGSEIQVDVQDKRGTTIERLKGEVQGDFFSASMIVPEKADEHLTFTAKLPKHGLEKKSDVLKIIPRIKVWNLKWSRKEARRGDVVKLTADIEGVPDETEVMLSIYEFDQDGAHDFITRFPCLVKNKKIEAEWEYEYHEDTDDILTQEEMEKYGKKYNPPEYFFLIDSQGLRFGEKQESKLLEFKDWIGLELYDAKGIPKSTEKYIVKLPDGSEKSGTLDSNGYARVDGIPPGPVKINFPDSEIFEIVE